MLFSRSRARFAVSVVVTGMLGALLSVAPVVLDTEAAEAADNGSLDFAATGPASILHGEDVTYTLSATHNGSGPDGYNLTYRVVLPADVAYVSSTIGKPTAEYDDAPSVGETTLLFENVADLQDGVTDTFEIVIDPTEASYLVGGSLTLAAGAYMSTDPRLIPDFSGTGAHIDNADTGAFDTDTVVTDVEAIRLTKTEPNAESELLRGVHTEWTTYSLQVDNNLVNPTNGLTIEDWLPAGVEFLGCGGVDQTEDSPVTNLTSATTEEYAGSGALGVGVTPLDPTGGAVVATCETPTTVETVTLAADEEFPGQEAGVYTHIVWDLSAIVGTMAASDQIEIMYAAGIPLRENTATFSGGHTNADHTADLDNNNGPFTTDEQELTNHARASATYNPGVDDLATSDEDSHVVIAEDLSIHKSVDDTEFVQSELAGWTMLVETGEYRDATGGVITDSLPDGHCPILSVGNPDPSDPGGECLQTGGIPAPTVDGVIDDPDVVTENTDGTWDIVWTTVPDLAINDDYTITFTSRVRDFYQDAGGDDVPVVGADLFVNDVDISATTAPIEDGGTELDRVTETTLDESSASQGSAVVEIDKSVSQPSLPGVELDCDAATYTTEVPPTPDEAGLAYRPGDRVCYRIVVDFISDLHFRNPRVTDFIPPNTSFERFWGDDPTTGQVLGSGPGADVVIDDVYDYVEDPLEPPSTSTTEGLEWTLGSTIPGGGTDLYVDDMADHFEVIFSVLIDGDPRDVTGVDIFDNLAKLTIQNNENSGGNTFSSRDQAGYPHVEPNISLDKRNAPAGSSTNDATESGIQDDEFDYEVDITNDFEPIGAADVYATAFGVDFWDILPVGIECVDVTTGPALSVAGSIACLDSGDGGYPLGGQETSGRSVLQGTLTSLAPGATGTLSYSLTLPDTTTAGASLVNDAGVRTYEGSDGNVGVAAGTDYYPTDNIDEANESRENTGPASDLATVNVPGPTVAKVQGSSDSDDGDDDGTNRTNSPESSAQQDATIGENVTYSFDVRIPAGTDMYDAVITDDLDGELDFVSFDAGSFSDDNGATTVALTIVSATDAYFDLDGSTTENAGDIAVDVASDDVTVSFPSPWNNDTGSLDDLLSLSFTTIVRDAPAVEINDNINNTVDLDWDDVRGNEQDTVSSSQVRTKVVEPNPQIAKVDDGTDTDAPPDGLSNVVPGDEVTYTLSITNPDVGNNHTSAAYDMVVTDVLPIGVSFDAGSGTDNPNGGVFVAGSPIGTEGTITWTQAEVAALAAQQVGAASIDITYTVTIDDPAVASGELTNTATVTAESREAESAGERTSYSVDTTDTLQLPLARIAKDLPPFDADPFDGSDTDVTTYAVGEPFDYEVTVVVGADTLAYDLSAFDELPAFLEFESYGTPTAISAACERNGGGALTAGDIISLTPDGQELGWFFGDVLANGADCSVTLPYTVHVDSVATTASTGANSASTFWHDSDDIAVDPTDVADLDGEVWDESAGPATESVDVIEPLLEIDKDVQLLPGPTECEATVDADACDTESGFTHRFTVTVTNTGDGAAHDVVVVDTLPAEGAGDPFNITGAPSPVFDGVGPRTLTWNVTGPIAAGGGSVTFTYDVLIGPSSVLEDDQELDNTAAVTSYWGLSESDRESAPGVLINDDVPEYHVDRNAVTPDEVTLTVEFPDLVIVKTPAAGMDDTDARVGEEFRWRLTVYNDGPGDAYDIDVGDDLPTGWLYDAGSATIDVGSGAVPLTDPTGGPAGPLLWTDVGQLDAGASFIIEFDTIPQASLLTLATTGTFDHVNDSSVVGDDFSGESSNETGDYGDDNGGPDGPRASDDDSARIRRVDLEIDKSIVETAPYFFGDFVTYRIVVTNDDATVAVDTATGVTVLDVLPSEVIFDSSTTANGSYDDGTDTWTLTDPLAAGASATLDIVVRINASTAFTNVTEVETTDQWDIDSTPGNHDDGAGPDEDDDDSVLLTPTNADLGNRIWFDVDADSVQDAGEFGIGGVDVEVSWIDPSDGTTVITRSTTTNSDGEYSFSDLPQDIDLTVTIDTADLPPGLVQTFELVDDPTITDTQAANAETAGAEDGVVEDIQLTGANPSYLDVDFGFTGSGSLGDYVWYDQNADGVQDGDEVGIDGVDITVEWAGFDGILGDDLGTPLVDESADDVTYPTTTAAGGAYLVENLPAGDYTVTVDTADLPSGIDIETWDPEFDSSGDPADLGSVSTYSLGDGEDHDGVDFGYVGPGRLGDTVWIDLDADGALDPDEVGIPGVTVTLTFTGPDGSLITRTVDTDTNGEYLFEGLPVGVALTVTADPADLPGNMAATHDIDDPADGSSVAGTADAATVTLTALEPENLDVDFGYRGLGIIGDTIWLDLDGSGEAAPQPDDLLLPNVEVTLTYTNPGGTDMVLTTTTAADGTYVFTDLPDGDYTITVNPATLPAGVDPIVDPDGGDDNTSALTLDDDPGTPLVNEGIDLDQDFAYVGTGSIGDTVWIDLDADGVLDADEVGIPGVDVTVVWTDPITGTTHTYETTTAADGTYGVGLLPGGDYTVSIDPTTLPEGMVSTYDLDGGLDRTTDVTLGAGEDRTDVDFGERREADLEIDKSSDAEFAVGSEAVWTITVTNDGPAIADGTITVSDDVPAGVVPNRVDGSGWTCLIDGQSVTCTLDAASLAVGASATFDLVVDVEAAAAPSVTNTAEVDMTGGPIDPNPINDADDDTASVPLALLGVEKDLVGSLVSGDEATWRIVITNYGPSPTNDDYLVVDDLPATLSFVRAETDGFTCTEVDSVVSCVGSTVLAVGDTATVDIITLVDAAPGEMVANSASVTGGNSPNDDPLPDEIIDELFDDPDEDLGIPDDTGPTDDTPPEVILAITGRNLMRMIWLGLLFALAGVVLVWAAKRDEPVLA
ncbi:MAG: SdrD B-like domain-containing protein [Actinomycetota bacterium]